MERIVVIGNGGSGKSFLSGEIAKANGNKLISLDDLFWEPEGFNTKRPKEIVRRDIELLKVKSIWVVEGVFGALAEAFMPYSDLVIFLDVPWEVCKASILSRIRQGQTEDSLKRLIDWCAEYYTRESKNSHSFHYALYECFNGDKLRFESRTQVNEWLESINKARSHLAGC
ncbi:hypothetical protein [Zooshikella ganghwensis]|uniref:AAA family ATPase n=1 Tax=Zooshikella ganghwensis TaxID=202772 RepID=A0A4P9VT67_9GAMM|nr:hypothetical protein [Zooshikella ganghwensis]RDH46356.1 AAA family ATPase [Zooshikella ganghwensis]